MTTALHLWPDRDPTRAVCVWPIPDAVPPGLIQEAREHLFVLTGGVDGDEPDLFIDDVALEALRAKPPARAVWQWLPGFHAGQVEGRLRLPSGDQTFHFTTDPTTRKLTRDAFDTMVREVLEDTFALFALTPFRKAVARGVGRKPPPIARLEFLRSRLDELRAVVASINERPRRILRAEQADIPLHRTRRATAPEILRSFQTARLRHEVGIPRLPAILGGRLPERIRQQVRRPSQDIAAHRQMKASLALWADWLESVSALLRAAGSQEAETSSTWSRRTRRMAREMRTMLALPMFEGVGEGTPRPDASPVWRGDPRYRRFAQIHRDLSLGIAQVFGDFLQMPLARTFDLYELWAYLRLARAAAERHGADPDDVAALFEGGQGVTLTAGSVRLPLRSLGLSLGFQRRYREFWLETDGRGSFSREMRPDIVVESLPDTPEVLVVLDAKYRVGADLNEALASAHMYRDALIRSDEESGVRRMVSAAYLLTPDAPVVAPSWAATPMPGRLFHPEYRGAFRFGAMTLAPGMTSKQIDEALDLILADAEI